MGLLVKLLKVDDNNRGKKIAGAILLVISVLILVYAAVTRSRYTPYESEEETKIFLYGDVPGVKQYYEKEYELWESYYTENGFRDLFLELPYYEAQLLNLWMDAEDDAILQEWYENIEGTRAHVDPILDFYRSIRENCPDTVFHGTDIGNRYDTSGSRYLAYLEELGETDSDRYRLAEECIEQGKTYSENKDPAYREETMTQNFIREYETLEDGSVMGIYADEHCDPRKNIQKGGTGSMAKQLQEKYGDIISYQAVEYMVKIEGDKLLEKQSSDRK